jgi:hypothetical protein
MTILLANFFCAFMAGYGAANVVHDVCHPKGEVSSWTLIFAVLAAINAVVYFL